MVATREQKGILRDIDADKINISEIGEPLRDKLADLIFHEPQLIDVDGPNVFLTEAGRKEIANATS